LNKLETDLTTIPLFLSLLLFRSPRPFTRLAAAALAAALALPLAGARIGGGNSAAAAAAASTVAAARNTSAPPSFLAVGPSATAGSFDFFNLNSEGQKTKVLLTFKVAAAEVAQEGAFGCGRGYCMMLTQVPALKQTILRNFSFFTPALLGTYTLPYLAYNLNTNEAENDDDFYGITVIQDHTKTPNTWVVAKIGDQGKTSPILDITANVGATGAVLQGATAYCGAGVSTLFVAVSRRGAGAGDTDTMLTIDTAGKRVTNTVQLNMPALASHFATCGGPEGALSVGGSMVVSSGFERHAIVVGSVDQRSGAFVPIDAADLPAAGAAAIPFDVSSVMAGVSPFSLSYASVLYSGFNRLPGLLFVSFPSQGRGSATVAPLDVLVYGIAEAF